MCAGMGRSEVGCAVCVLLPRVLAGSKGAERGGEWTVEEGDEDERQCLWCYDSCHCMSIGEERGGRAQARRTSQGCCPVCRDVHYTRRPSQRSLRCSPSRFSLIHTTPTDSIQLPVPVPHTQTTLFTFHSSPFLQLLSSVRSSLLLHSVSSPAHCPARLTLAAIQSATVTGLCCGWYLAA